jgi:glycosyltransferase involved in cell wall biosynthesis
VLTVDRIAEYGILNVDQIVAQTREQKVAIQHTWGREAIVVPNAHPIPPNNNCEKVTPPVVIWLGAIKPIKQPLIFLDLAAWCLDMNAPFIMAGALTDPTTVTEFKQRIGSVPNLVYLGSIPIHEASQLLQHASLLVNTSSSEGFPNVFIQAWLRNTPVVSLGVDPDGVIQANSICRCSSNFEDLVSDVRTLLANPNMLEELGKRGRNYAVQEHGLDRMVSIYEELFTGLSKRGLEARL